MKILTTYGNTFSDKLGITNLFSLSLQLQPGKKPVRIEPYRVNLQKADYMKRELQLMLEFGFIEESNSQFASPVVLVPKADGPIRFRSDFRRIASVTIPDSFSMALIDELIDKVGHAQFMTKLDLSRGYWQIPMDPDSIPMTAFVTPHGLFQWKVIPFGLRNVPSTFERLVKRILRGGESFTGSYLDDIIIFSYSWSEHLWHIQQVLNRIRSAGLMIKQSKCVFANAEVEFLGHKLGLGKVEPQYKTVQALIEFPRPSDIKRARSCLGLAGYYRRFLPHLAGISTSLTNLLQKWVKFGWTGQLKQKLHFWISIQDWHLDLS
jgi:Reverse transcriptase (RNA-dependent DNA polymerase)